MDSPLRVAVIGASGIGQHHARWHCISGCEIVAFVGSSEATCKRTKVRLEEDFGFNGRFYWDVQKMLQLECPDIVDVSSPYYLHHEHAIAALEAGAHVICEKPLCWDENKDLDWILKEGKSIVVTAKKAGLMLGVSAQYPAVIPVYREFYEQILGPLEKVEKIAVEMEVKGRKGRKSYQEIWIDMATHPLSLMIGFLPRSRIDYETLTCVISERENRASFHCISQDNRCAVDIVMRDISDGNPVRRFAVNGFEVEWNGYSDVQGIYRAMLQHGEKKVRCKDFLHMFIEEFVAAVKGKGGNILVSGKDGLLNLTHQVNILNRAEIIR